MRSRYSAFANDNRDYLIASWHPATRPEKLQLEQEMEWGGLSIEQTLKGQPGDSSGVVQFCARYRHGGVPGELRERSRFEQIDGRWYYLDGESMPSQTPKVGRNQPCPCGSGKKFKRCCG